MTVSPSTLNLGTAAIGTTSAPQTVNIANAGTTAVALTSVTATGDFAATTACTSLPAGQSCTVSVAFTPVLTGTRTGTLTINLASGAQTVSLTGTATSGSGGSQTLSLSPSTLTFSGYTVGDNPSKTITVTNPTSATVGIAGIAIAGDPSLTEKTTCGSSLASGATCTISVTFKPTAYGTFTGTMTLTEGNGALDTVSITATSTPDN